MRRDFGEEWSMLEATRSLTASKNMMDVAVVHVRRIFRFFLFANVFRVTWEGRGIDEGDDDDKVLLKVSIVESVLMDIILYVSCERKVFKLREKVFWWQMQGWVHQREIN